MPLCDSTACSWTFIGSYCRSTTIARCRTCSLLDATQTTVQGRMLKTCSCPLRRRMPWWQPYGGQGKKKVISLEALDTIHSCRRASLGQAWLDGCQNYLPICFCCSTFFAIQAACTPHTTERIRVQLAEFYRAINPYSDTLAKFPALFWILPVPFEILESHVKWCYKLEVARIFFCLIKDGLSPQLECAMITFLRPEIQEDPSLLEVVSTSRASAAGARKKSCASVLGGVSVCDKHVVRIRPEGPSHIYIYMCVYPISHHFTIWIHAPISRCLLGCFATEVRWRCGFHGC